MVYRSYFSKNNTLIENNETNNSQNPVTEISYGTTNAEVSRFIFDIDFEPLINRIEEGIINPLTISKHVLHITNTIAVRPDLMGKKFATADEVQRTGSFDLELFNVTEDWDEGNGYDFVYDDERYPLIPQQASNWFDRKTNIPWSVEGAYISGTTFASQTFEKGAESIEIDVTDYINSRIFSGTTGITAFTGTSYGLGLKFPEDIEALVTRNRQAVAFHVKNTNTFFEPFIETTYNNSIQDDRNFFYQDKNNSLFLYSSAGNERSSVTINKVDIYDYMGNVIDTISGDSVEIVSLGVYKINLNILSTDYPDAVIFNDVWSITQNGTVREINNDFYLISPNNFYNFTLSNRINFDNFWFNYYGLAEGEKVKRGELRRIQLEVKQHYSQDDFLPLDLDYRLYIVQAEDYIIEVIPFQKVNRTSQGYEFTLDTSWLIPQDYKLELRLNDGNLFAIKNPINFTIFSSGKSS